MTLPDNPVDEQGITQPIRPPAGLDSYQSIRIPGNKAAAKKTSAFFWGICGFLCVLMMFVMVYLFAPLRTNLLILGIDGGLGRGDLGRTDTMILATISPLEPYVGLLSIPRDLWVPIEGVGENRINTAYFFAEAQQAGSGSQAAIQVVDQNFHVHASYYIIVRMDGVLDFIDALGGVDITLSQPSAGFNVGRHHLDGPAALVFARSRAGADDFSRMVQGQILIKAVVQRMLQPAVWPRLPEIITATGAVVNMNIPIWQWPRLSLAILRVGKDQIDSRSITRDMVRPFTTNQGAQVLAPDWDLIDKLVAEMFGIR